MKPHSFIFCCLFLSTAFSQAEEPVWGKTQNGLKISCALPAEKFKVGEPVPISFVKHNASEKELQIWHSGFWANHQIRVCDPQGKLVELTAVGKNCFEAFAPGGVRDKNFDVVLKPGGEDKSEGNYDLGKFYNLTRPGLYSVQCLYEEYQGGWEGAVWSNVLVFQVVKEN